VPLQQQPENSKLVLHATLVTPDGRSFNASETVRVNPPGLAGNADQPFVMDAKAPARKEAAKNERPNAIRPAAGEKLMAPSPEPGRSSLLRPDTFDGGRAGSGAFAPSTRRGNGDSPALSAPVGISYEREGDPLFDLIPPDRGDRKARADAPRKAGTASANVIDSPGISNSNPLERAGQSRTGAPQKKASVPFDRDLRPSVAVQEMDEFGLPKNWQGGAISQPAPADHAFDSPADTSERKAPSHAELPDWAR
jgi:hypothetical protein